MKPRVVVHVNYYPEYLKDRWDRRILKLDNTHWILYTTSKYTYHGFNMRPYGRHPIFLYDINWPSPNSTPMEEFFRDLRKVDQDLVLHAILRSMI